MKLSRRDVLVACASVGVARVARAQVSGPFALAFPAAPLAVGDSIGLAVYASEPCTIEASLTDVETRTLVAPIKLQVSAGGRAVSASSGVTRSLNGPVSVQMMVFPDTARRPYVAAVVESPGKSSRQDLQHAAENALFVKNPAARPAPGYFLIDLKTDADVTLTISESRRAGRRVRQRTDRNLRAGADTHIPWDLLDDAGQLVSPSEYAATIVATPKMAGRSNTMYASTLRVV